MSPPSPPPPSGSTDAEMLSAYLAGDLDEPAAAALEARLADDPALARRLDDTARVVAALRGVDEVVPPHGTGDRLRARLATERGRAATPVTSLQARRRRVPWPALGGVAAGLAAAALVVGGVLQADDGAMQADRPEAAGPDAGVEDSAEMPQDEALDADAQSEARERLQTSDDAGDEEAAAPVPAPDGHDDQPVVLDTQIRLDERGDARRRYADLPEASALLGEAVDAATDRALAYRAAVSDAPAFESGATPDACLDEVGTGSEPLVPARVESVVYEDHPALAYVLVTAAEGSPTLDRIELWIVRPPDCGTRLFLDLS